MTVLAFEAGRAPPGRHDGHRAGAADTHHVDADADGVVDLVHGLGQLAVEDRDVALSSSSARLVTRGFGGWRDGQGRTGRSPSRQEKSLLQDDWWMRVLRPNSVWNRSTLMQLDSSPQLLSLRRRAVDDGDLGRPSALPRLRRAQFGGTLLVVDQHGVLGVAASSFWASSRRSRA